MNTIDQLAEKWQRYKLIEQNAAAERKAIELQLMQLIEIRDEGTSTEETDHYNIKTVGKLNRTLDAETLQDDWDNLPKAIKDCVKWKPQVDTAALRVLESMNDELVPLLSKYMTTKPAKPTFKVEPIQE